MKLYAPPEPDFIIRVMISKLLKNGSFEREYINLEDTTQAEVKKWIEGIILKQKISPFVTGNKTSICIREAVGAKNGKSISISLHGLSPKQIIDLLHKDLNK